MREWSGRSWLRLFWILLGASVLPIAGAGLVIASWLEDTARQDARVRLGSLGELGAALMRQRIAQAEATLALTGRVLGPVVADARASDLERAASSPMASINGTLEQTLGQPSPFLDVQIYADRDEPALLGQQLSPELAQAQRQIVDLPAYQNAQFVGNINSEVVQTPLQNGLWRSERVERDFGFPTVRLSAPTLEDGSPNGAVVGYLDLRALPDDLRPIAEAGCRAALTDRDGGPLAAVGPADETADAAVSIAQDVGFGGWTLEVRMPEERIVAAAAGARDRVIGWTVGAGLLAALASLAIARRISRPVARLTAAAEAMSAGRLDARAGIAGNDEFAKLGAAFDRMARSVEDLDRARSSFVGTVSHELRTPLTSMQLTLDNVRDGIAGPVPDAIRSSLDRVRGDCGRMLGLVEDLLQMTRIDAGIETPDLQIVDLTTAVREVVTLTAPLAERAGKSLRQHGDPRAASVHADPDLLRRILTNLCANGIEHSRPRGRIDVEVDAGRVRVISDGGGLDPERHSKPFARGDSAAPGAGLGLHLVERLAGLQRGSIGYETLESASGPRTSVTLRLPIATEGPQRG